MSAKDGIYMDELRAFAKSYGGGSNQAKAFEESFFAQRNQKSELRRLLLQLWRWGTIPATLVQKIAHAAQTDLNAAYGLQINEWQSLSKLGSSGLHAQNIQRDLLRQLPKPFLEASWTDSTLCFLTLTIPIL